jgi:preprotein translocase subunit SecA
VDSRWREHLYDMEGLREGIGWRGLSQRDPLVEYKREGFDMFQEMESGLKEDYVTYIYRIENVKLREEPEVQQFSYSGGGEEPSERPKSPRKVEGKIGRNDPCPCGSGQKYKKCGMLNTPEHQRFMAQNPNPAATAG